MRRRRALDHARVVLRAVRRRDLRIAPAVILNQLAAAIEERLQVRVERVDGVAVGLVGARDVGVEVELLTSQAGSSNTRKRNWSSPVARADAVQPMSVHPSSLPGSEAGNLAPGLGILRRRVDQPRRLDLRARVRHSAVAGALALQHRRIELAARRVLDQAVLHAVERVAGLDDRAVQKLTLRLQTGAPPGLCRSAFATRTACAARPVQSRPGAPAMMPSKSAGNRCASFIA